MGCLEIEIVNQLEKMNQEMVLIRQTLQSLLELEQDKVAIDKSKDVELDVEMMYDSIEQLVQSGQIAQRISNALRRSNIKVVKDLTYVTPKNIKKVSNLGKKSYQYLIKFKEDNNLDIIRNKVPDKLPDVKIGDRIVYCGNEELSNDFLDLHVHKGDVLTVTDIQDRSSNTRFMLPVYTCRISLTSGATFRLSPGQIATID